MTLTNYSTVVMHIGGNDANMQCDLDEFRESFGRLALDITSKCTLIVSGLTPRHDIDIEVYDDIIQSVCSELISQTGPHFCLLQVSRPTSSITKTAYTSQTLVQLRFFVTLTQSVLY